MKADWSLFKQQGLIFKDIRIDGGRNPPFGDGASASAMCPSWFWKKGGLKNLWPCSLRELVCDGDREDEAMDVQRDGKTWEGAEDSVTRVPNKTKRIHAHYWQTPTRFNDLLLFSIVLSNGMHCFVLAIFSFLWLPFFFFLFVFSSQ